MSPLNLALFWFLESKDKLLDKNQILKNKSIIAFVLIIMA